MRKNALLSVEFALEFFLLLVELKELGHKIGLGHEAQFRILLLYLFKKRLA